MEAGGPALYDPQKSYGFQEEQFGAIAEAVVYVRPAYYGLLLKPLTWLGSYGKAYAAYTGLRILAIVGFILLWPKQGRWDATMFTMMSLPLFVGMANGQDGVLLLPLIAWAFRSIDRGKEFEAGLALSLCAVKPHLLVLVPVALVAQRRWGALRGGLCGGAALFALSCVSGGFGWVGSFLRTVELGVIHPNPQTMPNLAGLLEGTPHVGFWTAIGTSAALVAVAIAARRGSFAEGFAAATVGSLFVSGHAYAADVVVLLPGLLVVVQDSKTTPTLKLLAFLWLEPVLPLLVIMGSPASYIPQTLLPLTLFAIALAASRRRFSPPTERRSLMPQLASRIRV